MKILRVGYSQATHAVLMTPLLEMSFKCSSPPVAIVPTYLAFEFLI